jgi:hypothetical protein
MLRVAISRLARHPALVVVVLFLSGVALTALPSLRYGPPLPTVHDEYGYLLMGETFARGRLTNDPPPGPPEFFDTFHEFISPRYFAKFPPGQGIALAVGILLGHPIIGIWLVQGLWAVALGWMLRAAVPTGWAVGGALAGLVGYGAMSDWGYSYWGGSVLALGGALTFGGALRLWQREGSPLAAAAWAGVGCGIMALTRPLDGFIFALFPTGMIAWTLWRDRAGRLPRLFAFVLPAALGVALMLGYNIATTGQAWLFAHRLYDQTHVPRLALFVWEKPGVDPPGLPDYLADYEQSYKGSMSADPLRFAQYWANVKVFVGAQSSFLFPIWVWPLVVLGLAAAFIERNGPARLAILGLLSIAFPLLTLRFYGFSHYIAAWTAPALLLIICGTQQRKVLWSSLGSAARHQVWITALILALWPVVDTTRELGRGFPSWLGFGWVYDRELVREALADRAKQTGHPQMAIVIYALNHSPHAEWVFNSPDPASQDVMWVRALGPARVPELARVFPKHDEWLVYVKANGDLDHRDLIKRPGANGEKPTPPATKG